MTQPNRWIDSPDQAIFSHYQAHSPGKLSYAQFAQIFRELNQAIRNIARIESVPLVDLDTKIGKTSNYMYDAVHLTVAGSRAASGRIAEVIAQHLSLKP